MREDLRVEIDFHEEPKWTLIGVKTEIERKIQENPDRDYWMDGDTFCILSAKKERVA